MAIKLSLNDHLISFSPLTFTFSLFVFVSGFFSAVLGDFASSVIESSALAERVSEDALRAFTKISSSFALPPFSPAPQTPSPAPLSAPCRRVMICPRKFFSELFPSEVLFFFCNIGYNNIRRFLVNSCQPFMQLVINLREIFFFIFHFYSTIEKIVANIIHTLPSILPRELHTTSSSAYS